MKTITIEVERASDAQIKTLLADLSIQMEPWQRYIKYKIKNGSHKRQAPSDMLDNLMVMG